MKEVASPCGTAANQSASCRDKPSDGGTDGGGGGGKQEGTSGCRAEVRGEQLSSQQMPEQLSAQQISEELAKQNMSQQLSAQQMSKELTAQQMSKELTAQQMSEELSAQQMSQHLTTQQMPQQLSAQQMSKELTAQQMSEELSAQQMSQQLTTQQMSEELSAQQMYEELQRVDLVTARRTHPNDKRKILRALEVFRSGGRPLSTVLAEQHAAAGGGGVSGPLRYDQTLVFNLQCDRQVLDERTDRRVDQMIAAGLIEELSDFHNQYNRDRLKDNREADYTIGIFQSIGFKEFHEYLLLRTEERESEKGKCLFKLGVEELKRVTRRYARRQTTWFKNRFLKRRGSEVPRVYAVDSTDPLRWRQDVHDVAASVIQAVIDGRVPPVAPLSVTESTNTPAYNTCTACDMVFVNTHTWTEHLRGRRHRNTMKRKARLDGGMVSDKGKKRVCAVAESEGAERTALTTETVKQISEAPETAEQSSEAAEAVEQTRTDAETVKQISNVIVKQINKAIEPVEQTSEDTKTIEQTSDATKKVA